MRSLLLQNSLLSVLSKGGSRSAMGEALCLEIERILPGVLCSLMLVDAAGLLHPIAAPSFTAAFAGAVDGALIGPAMGACGTAAYLGMPVLVEDIATDPRWVKIAGIDMPKGIKACWSSPIIDENGQVLAVIGLYFRESRAPRKREIAVVKTSSDLLRLALQWQDHAAETERKAGVDALTGLPGRGAFAAALARLPCDVPGLWAVMIIDLDNLKVVNDTFGHAAGDALIKAAARRISSAVQPDILFRIGGDEFALIVQNADALRDLEAAAAGILAKLSRPTPCDGHAVVPKATIGGAVPGPGDSDPSIVQQNADFALYHAKETGRGGFVRYWPGIGARMIRRRDAIRHVSEALSHGRIEAHYQPVLRLDSREIVGIEALCRLRMPDGGLVPAARFQEAMSDVRIGSDLTGRMLSIVAGDVLRWLAQGLPIQQVGVNIGMADFHAGRLCRQIEASFDRLGVSRDHLAVEVAERLYMNEKDDGAVRTVRALRAAGLAVALDDFGVGQGSLTQIMGMPVRILKIDRCVIARLETGDPAVAIVEGLIHIGRQLGIRVVAEGVESERQADRLLAMGCLLAQGHAFSPAVPCHAITALLRRHSQGLGGATPMQGARRPARRPVPMVESAGLAALALPPLELRTGTRG